MQKTIQLKIEELEDYIGFPITRKEISFESNGTHDETFSYGLCQRFYGKNKELQIAIKKTENILIGLIKFGYNKKKIALFFSLLGDMYYIASDFNRSINCFMKALSYNKDDMTNWVGLMFSFRADGNIEIFEDIIFNFEDIYNSWKKDTSSEMNQEKIYNLIRK